MAHKYTDNNGETILLVSSSVPGVTFVPPGLAKGDAKQISEGERELYLKEMKAKEPAVTEPTLAELSKQADALQADIQKLKANGVVDKLK